jgi:hypothetical protein
MIFTTIAMSKIDSLKSEYDEFLSASPTVDFDDTDVPQNLLILIPYASFWGISDDYKREQLSDSAPLHVKQKFKKLITEHDDALDQWLAGADAHYRKSSAAYIAFSAMRMAADYM